MSARVPPPHCAVEGGALPLGLEQVNWEMCYKAPIVSQLARSQSPPSARGVLFVCSSPKCSLGSRQIKSQLAHLGHEGQCGMCWLAGSVRWQAAFPGRQRSLAGSSPRCGHGRQERRCGTCCSHTAPTEASLVPWQVPVPRRGQPHRQGIPSGSDTGAPDLLTKQLVSNTGAFWSFYLICSTRQLLLQ